jgi:hypothetical protein
MLRRLFALALIAYSVVLLKGKEPAPSVDAPPDTTLVLTAQGTGFQIYGCTDGHWTLKGPDAQLLDDHGKLLGTHFVGPTWRLADGSEVKGKMIATQPSPDAASVPWLLLQALPGSGSGKFAHVGYVRRSETHGGVGGAEPCTTGDKRVPYAARYDFYGTAVHP